jgi:hypothetical protein
MPSHYAPAGKDAMNLTNHHMNDSAATTTVPEVPYFKAQCNRRAIHVPGDDPRPSEIIPIIEQRLAAHQKHCARTMNPWTGDFAEWKMINDGLTDLLQELRAADAQQKQQALSQKPSEACAKVEPTLQPQHNPDEPTVSHTAPMASQPASQAEPTQSQDAPAASHPAPGPGHSDQPFSQPYAPSFSSTADNAEEDEQPDDPDDPVSDAREDLQSRVRGSSRMDELTVEQQDIVFALLHDHSSRAVVKILREPSPPGFNFKVSRCTLDRFWKKRRALEVARQQAERVESAAALLDSENADKAFQQAAERALKLRLLTSPDASVEQVDALISALNKLRKQSLAERKQAHAEYIQKYKLAVTPAPK